jgi:ABC-type lipoprotein export system ATPase subunit
MFDKRLVITDKIDYDLINDYVAMIYKVIFKTEHERENELTIDFNAPVKYVRFVNKVDIKYGKHIINNITLDNNERLMLFPYFPRNGEEERSMLYLTGSSGSGKTYFVNAYCQIYEKFYKGKNKLFFLTMNNWKVDKSLDKEIYEFVDMNKFINYFKDEENIKEFATSTNFDNSLFVFDDIGSLDKKEEAVVWRIINIILEFKRKNKISCIIISHQATLGHLSKKLIPEIKNYVIFPKNLQVKSNRLLKTYLGLDTKQLYKIVEEDYKKSVWVSIDTQRRIVITQHEAYFL